MSDEGLFDWIEEALAPLGEISARRMMGGRTVYCDGAIFALLVREELWFKSDAESDAIWDEAGCERFSYSFKDGRINMMNYRRAPADVHDDPDEMRRWAALAIAAGQRGAAKKKPKR